MANTRAEDAEKQTPQEPMPSSKQKTPEPTNQEQEAPATVTKPEAEGEALPEGTKERTTQQFEKLQKQLQEERKQRMELETLVSSGKQTPDPKGNEFYDPGTGMVDAGKLKQNIDLAQQTAQRAEAAVKNQQQMDERRQEVDAHEAYPQLNPDADPKTFNGDFYRKTRAVLTDSMVYPEQYGGRKLTLKEAADMVGGNTPKAVADAKELGAKEAVESLTPKEQASLEATGRSDRRGDLNSNLEDLQTRSRKGDLEAIVQRLKTSSSVAKG